MCRYKRAKCPFDSDWTAQLNIDLDFVNNGMFTHALQTALGETYGYNSVAGIPDYSEEKLLIDAGISDVDIAIRDYFPRRRSRRRLAKRLMNWKLASR
ncbi:MAG: hypothetical protein GPOALKHO_001839 [Sodalis sp.]|uniref:YhdP family protein n=1 Tax=Sodalis sp. (in: enterobacteria) TaxID=1898979 RepID=UPI00387327B7|nr:MAG: hypothetical protein GPOALKHO_001839 [Sodalis sp.]